MTKSHTESPWHKGKRAGKPAIYGKNGEEIAEILFELTPEWKSNFHLIASTPELLAALKAVKVGLECLKNGLSIEDPFLVKDCLEGVCKACLAITEDAINKAKA